MSQRVNTVTGPIAADALGLTLMHEHIVYGYAGWEGDLTMAPFNRGAIIEAGVEYLTFLKALGVVTFVDATPVDGGRQPEIYREISEQTGVHIICATGYYYEGGGAAAYFKFRHALSDATGEMAELFVKEITEGIRDTGIRAGIIKIGSSKGVITEYEKMVFRAAARAQRETGAPIITHTQQGTMGPEQVELLLSAGADPNRIQIGHMCDNLHLEDQLRILERGVCVGWDRMGLQGMAGCPMDEERYPLLLDLIGRGYLQQLTLSCDYVNYWLGRPRRYPTSLGPLMANLQRGHLLTRTLPDLRERGLSGEQIRTILVENPRRLFTGGCLQTRLPQEQARCSGCR